MMDLVTFEKENHKRIQAVESSFGPAGRHLCQPGRVLRQHHPERPLAQKNRKSSLSRTSCWRNLEDKEGLSYKWLVAHHASRFLCPPIRSKRKQAWMEQIGNSRLNLLQRRGSRPGSTFAVTWIPDKAAYKCMRCFKVFKVDGPAVLCHKKKEEMSRLRGDITRKTSTEEEDEGACSDEEEGGKTMQNQVSSSWLDYQNGNWGGSDTYVAPRPMHLR
ncbi:hypothetical protein KUCAC02_023226 [Chaenocephalus aceratus]|uniref:Uncharacterized protein n=1 Tax=Chaenocephalus aceratus TaxID=36190 RepID=A0ACB9XQG1_CHAAC|nr:hypothetical protein KUCAC02_023226 [Chaenocephalus aceratus]